MTPVPPSQLSLSPYDPERVGDNCESGTFLANTRGAKKLRTQSSSSGFDRIAFFCDRLRFDSNRFFR